MGSHQPRIYLDYNASAPLRDSARAAMLATLGAGNASSVHAEGRAARRRVEAAREAVATLVGADPRGVTFTSGATEANATVLTPRWTRGGAPVEFTRLLVSSVEHPSVLAGGRFPAERVTRIPVDRNGVIDVAALDEAVARETAAGGRLMVSLMAANNETGVIQPVAEAAAIVHAAGGLAHADVVQAAGKLPLDLATLRVDVVTLSAHKIGGPQGVGAVIRADSALAFAPLVAGGGQEAYARAGTENVAAIAGFGAAAVEAAAEAGAVRPWAKWQTRIEQRLVELDPRTVILGAGAARLPNTIAFALPGVLAETAVIALDLAGIAVSSGSACSSGKVAASHVLAAMGAGPDIARGGVRVSFGHGTTEADIAGFLAAWQAVLPSLRSAAGRAA